MPDLAWLVVSHLAAAVVASSVTYVLAQFTPTTSGDTTMHIDSARVRRSADRWFFGAAILALVIAAVTSVLSVVDSRDQQRCFNEYANELASSLEPRQAAAEERTDAEVAWQDAVAEALMQAETVLANPAADPDPLADALRDFRAADTVLAAAEERLAEERRENPYPAAPREVC